MNNSALLNDLDNNSSEKKQEYLVEFGLYIKKLRIAKSIKAIELASWLDSQKSTISRLESGGINPTLFYLKKLSEGLDITLTDLIEGFEKEFKANK